MYIIIRNNKEPNMDKLYSKLTAKDSCRPSQTFHFPGKKNDSWFFARKTSSEEKMKRKKAFYTSAWNSLAKAWTVHSSL